MRLPSKMVPILIVKGLRHQLQFYASMQVDLPPLLPKGNLSDDLAKRCFDLATAPDIAPGRIALASQRLLRRDRPDPV